VEEVHHFVGVLRTHLLAAHAAAHRVHHFFFTTATVRRLLLLLLVVVVLHRFIRRSPLLCASPASPAALRLLHLRLDHLVHPDLAVLREDGTVLQQAHWQATHNARRNEQRV
jgi:hypothetical protein